MYCQPLHPSRVKTLKIAGTNILLSASVQTTLKDENTTSYLSRMDDKR